MKKAYIIPTIKVACVSQTLLIGVSGKTEADPNTPSLSKYYNYEWSEEDSQ